MVEVDLFEPKSPEYQSPFGALILNLLFPGVVFWQHGMKKTGTVVFCLAMVLSVAAMVESGGGGSEQELSSGLIKLLAVAFWLMFLGLPILAFWLAAREHSPR